MFNTRPPQNPNNNSNIMDPKTIPCNPFDFDSMIPEEWNFIENHYLYVV